jgi:hypothetical protein
MRQQNKESHSFKECDTVHTYIHLSINHKMKKTSTTKISRLSTLGLTIVFGLSALIMAGCGQSSNKGNAPDKPADTLTAKADTGASAIFKSQLPGAWIQQESGAAKVKKVFTAAEVSDFDNDILSTTYGYKWINDKQIEVDMKQGKILFTVSVTGDELTLIAMDIPVKYKRETVNSSVTDTPPFPGNKQDPKLLIGKWTVTVGLKTTTYEFMNNGTYSLEEITKKEDPQFGPDKIKEQNSYRITNDNKLELFNYYSKAILETGNFTIEDDGNTLVKTVNGATLKLSRVKAN